jgi:hypothetical protein
VLVGDREREQAATALRRHFVHGRLSAAELADRVEQTLRARSRDELEAAMSGLPLVWEDLPVGIYSAARRVRHGVRRVTFFLALVRLWLKLNLALALAFGVAVAVGAPADTTLAAVIAASALATFAVWRMWRRAAWPPSARLPGSVISRRP